MKYQQPVGGAANDPYVTGVPGVTPGSIPPGAAIEAPQREILAVIEGEGLTPDAGDLTQLHQAIRRNSNHGQCQLTLSGGLLTLLPFNGNKVSIAGFAHAIPPTGITLPATGATDGLLYYIYVYINSGVPTLERSAIGHSTDTTTGVEIKTGDATRTLVGMALTVSGAWTNTSNQRFVRSWFNRVSLKGSRAFQAERSTASSTPTETSAADRCEFLVWPGETVMASASSQVSILSSATSISVGLSLYVDGITHLRSGSVNPDTVNQSIPCVVPAVEAIGLSEGYHYMSPFIAWSGSVMGYHAPNNSGISLRS